MKRGKKETVDKICLKIFEQKMQIRKARTTERWGKQRMKETTT